MAKTNSAEAAAPEPATTGSRELQPQEGNDDGLAQLSEEDILAGAIQDDGEPEPGASEEDRSLTEPDEPEEPGSSSEAEKPDDQGEQPEPKPEADDSELEEDEDDPISSRLGRKRDAESKIKQLTARSHKAEARVKELEAENQQLRGGSGNPQVADPELQELQKKQSAATAEVDGATALLRRLNKGELEQVSAAIRSAVPNARIDPDDEDSVRGFLEQHREQFRQESSDLRADIRARERTVKEQVEQARKRYDDYAGKTLPWLSDTKDSRYKRTAQILREFPEVGTHPLGLLSAALLAKHIEDQAAAKKLAAAAKPDGKVRPSAAAGGASGKAQRVPAKGTQHEGSLEAAAKRARTAPEDESADLDVYSSMLRT